MTDNPYRALPSLHQLKAAIEPSAPIRGEVLTRYLQAFLDQTRAEIRVGRVVVKEEVEREAKSLVMSLFGRRSAPVINATGVVIHTNLGRASVSEETALAMAAAASNAVALEIEPESNERGGRMNEISQLMRALTGAEATLVVNNNAAAVLLVLSALAAGKSVIVSRGEAVEIGGGFRIPDVMTQGGARLIDVGTTNRTYPSDYEAASDADTALFLKVHASNFKVEGFTATTTVAQLSPVAKRLGIPIVEDLGSGALIDTSEFGLHREVTVGESLADGAAIVTFSGDKLLGGPQAGFVAGRADLAAMIARHPLARAVRADKTCLAGVAATLTHYVRGDAVTKIPIWRMISAGTDSLHERANAIRDRLAQGSVSIEIVESESTVGGGSMPGQRQASVALSLADEQNAIDELAKSLRIGMPGVFGRIEHDRLLLDLRTVLPEHDDVLAEAIVSAVSGRVRPA